MPIELVYNYDGVLVSPEPMAGQKFVPMRKSDVMRCVEALPRPVRRAMEHTNVKWRDTWVAGGFIRSILMDVPVRDVDVFSPTGDVACPKCHKHCGRYADVSGDSADLNYARTLNEDCLNGVKVQIVRSPLYLRPTPRETIALFDVTVSQAAIFYSDRLIPFTGGWHGICAETYYEDLAAKRIRVVNKYSLPPRRLARFRELGFHIPEDLAYEAASAILLNDGEYITDTDEDDLPWGISY